MRISDWSSDVCSSDLGEVLLLERHEALVLDLDVLARRRDPQQAPAQHALLHVEHALVLAHVGDVEGERLVVDVDAHDLRVGRVDDRLTDLCEPVRLRSEEHTSELQSLMRISYAVFCLQKTKYKNN